MIKVAIEFFETKKNKENNIAISSLQIFSDKLNAKKDLRQTMPNETAAHFLKENLVTSPSMVIEKIK